MRVACEETPELTMQTSFITSSLATIQQEIVQLGDPLLRCRSERADMSNGHEMQDLWSELEGTLERVMSAYEFRRTAGISAIQIGRPVRACIVWQKDSGIVHIANPILLYQSKRTDTNYEGCLSFFDKRGLVARPSTIRIAYYDRACRRQTRWLRGELARIVSHEMDHMDGILYVDRMAGEDALIPYEEYMTQQLAHMTP